MTLKKYATYFLWLIVSGILLALILILISGYVMDSYIEDTYSRDELMEIPEFETGLLLGTSKYVIGGSKNMYYKYRLKAAYELWKNGRIKNILVSGDNATVYYNEPQTIKEDLIKMGVPDTVIYLDYAGFRTFDSVVRAQKVFMQDSILIISQRFHNLRALFIADKVGIFARAYNAHAVTEELDLKTQIRERLARVKALLDIYVLNTEPRYLGKPVKID